MNVVYIACFIVLKSDRIATQSDIQSFNSQELCNFEVQGGVLGVPTTALI